MDTERSADHAATQGTSETSQSSVAISPVSALRSAFRDLLNQEITWSTGHLTTLLNGCVFAPSLLTFWLVNGLLDFSTAIAIGSVVSPGGLTIRLIAYLLLVPVFLALRASFYLIHPTHRREVLSGACPQSDILSLDWFSVGILATGLPLALQDAGPWIGMNLVFVFGVFVVPQFLPPETADIGKIVGIGSGIILFLYANYGDRVAHTLGVIPSPSETLGPIATFALSPSTTDILLSIANSLATGPVLIGGFALLMNYVLTRPALTNVPFLRHTLPRRDPRRLVFASAALGTTFYLLVVAGVTGQLVILP